MFQSYLKIAYRSILKNREYSVINIFGLSLGIACSLLLFNYVRFESSFDNFHPNVDRTYRVDRDLDEGRSGSTAPPLAFRLKSNYPEVEDVMRVNTPGDNVVRLVNDNEVLSFNESHIYAADSNFFSFFGFDLKEGDSRTALQGLNKVVISEAIAEKFFGDKPALGNVLLLGDRRTPIEVTGVTAAQPENSHFHFDYLLSMDINPSVRQRDWSWVWTQVATYVRLRPGADPKALEVKMKQLAEKVIKPAFLARGMNYENTLKGKGNWNFYLTAMRDIHLMSGDNRLGPVGNVTYVYAFGGIGIFVLLIAAINFINLSTASAAKRAREVGVKKAMGALRGSLVTQFQIETVALTTCATLLAIVLVEGLQLLIANVAEIDIPFTLLNPTEMLWVLPLIPLVIGFLAGLYPSFYLTSFRPVQVLKGRIASGMGDPGIRNGLVTIQFCISIALIAGTTIVFQQLKFVNSTNLGFDRENILLIKHADKLGNQLESFRNEVESYPGVQHAGITMEVPGGGVWSDDFFRETSDLSANVAIVKTDQHYFETLGFELVAGRAFDEDRLSDRNAVIPNETTIEMFGWTPEEAIGQYLVYPGNDNSRHEIIGVMKDFHYQSLHVPIIPVMFCNVESDIWGDWRVLTIKFESGNIEALIQRLHDRWNEVLDDTPFEYSFLDQDLSTQYQTEQRLGGLFGIFSALSILIAVIGLVGLVSYSAEVRRKEIGIRKVFGASTPRIMLMMNSQYMRLVLVASAVAIPFSWLAVVPWLDSFEYRIGIGPLPFITAGLTQLIIAVLCVGYLSFRAASANPSNVLRDE